MSGALRRAIAAALLTAALPGCGRPPGPAEVVLRYRDALARDPIRTLALLTPAFHRAHGLRFLDVADLPPASGERRSTRPDTAPAPSADPALELERARLGWLTALTRPAFARYGPRLAIAIEDVATSGDTARVATRVRLGDSPGFRALFRLVRADGSWRIDAIAIDDEAALPVVPVYLLAPTLARHRRLEAWRRGLGATGASDARAASRQSPAQGSVHARHQSGGSSG